MFNILSEVIKINQRMRHDFRKRKKNRFAGIF